MKLKRIFFIPVLLFLLASCGSASASGDAPTSLHITRTSTNSYTVHFSSLDRTVTDTPTVQQLYAAAYKLPLAKGTYNCPKDIGLLYHLNFFQDSSSMQKMDLQASSCRFLYISKMDVRVVDPTFLSLFTKTIGIASLIPVI